jgi:hypothetical protein
MMRGVYLPPGSHTVEFSYEPLSIRLGLVIAGGTVALIVIFLILGWKFGGRWNIGFRSISKEDRSSDPDFSGEFSE